MFRSIHTAIHEEGGDCRGRGVFVRAVGVKRVQKSCPCATGVKHLDPSVLHVIVEVVAGRSVASHLSSLHTDAGGRWVQETVLVAWCTMA